MTGEQAFELYLISLMRASAAVVDAVLKPLGMAPEAVDAAVRRMDSIAGFLNLVTHDLDVYIGILGNPLETSAEPGILPGNAFEGSQRHRFHLPLWPTFDFILRTHPGGWVWEPEFVRKKGTAPPHVSSVSELRPWTVVESEVVALFGPPTANDAWNLGKDATWLLDQPNGKVEAALSFDLELLQSVTIMPPESPRSQATHGSY